MITIQDTIKRAIDLRGMEILKDKKRFCILLEDLSPTLKEERELIEKTYDDKVGRLFYEAGRSNAAQARAYLTEAGVYLEEDCGFNEKWRNKLVFYFESVILRGAPQYQKSATGFLQKRGGQTTNLEKREEAPRAEEQNANVKNAYSMQEQAYCYLWGVGTSPDMEKASALFSDAFHIYEQEAERGNAEAQYWCGYFYENGIDTKKSSAALEKWYKKASEKKDSAGVPYFDKGRRRVEWRTEEGWKESEFYFGRIDGADRNEILAGVREMRNDKKAVFWYQRAAGQGEKRAQCRLGVMYRIGIKVKKDIKTGNAWIEKSAMQGYDEAQYILALSHALGMYGIKKDVEKALEWYEKAAIQGNKKAQDVLVKMK